MKLFIIQKLLEQQVSEGDNCAKLSLKFPRVQNTLITKEQTEEIVLLAACYFQPV